MPLPVEDILAELRIALAQGHAVLSSPPGSGKTTRVPLALLNEYWLKHKKIIMLEPRRPAVRMAARYMAALQGEAVGQSVGYQVRMERKISSRTRIEVLTEGLLVRRLQTDPELTGVGLVIFDEFHEQSLQSELGLALCLDICDALRDDLRLLVMSATLDEQSVADLIGGRVVVSDGGLFPVVVQHIAKSVGRDVLSATLKLVRQACEEQQGDILVFLPGKGEIDRLEEQLLAMAIPAEIFRLHGEMDVSRQARVLLPAKNHGRRVVLTTDVAETSLTIEGITTVVDSGLSRKPVFDPDTGLSRLRVLPISRASAAQRAGRAGRLEPGICYRAWTETEHRQRPSQRPPEILHADLASAVLELALWGVADRTLMTWLNRPPAAAWCQAVKLLRKLEALNDSGHITAHGKQLAMLGVHPRLAHLLVCGGSGNILAADIAALLSDRDPWRNQPGRKRPADLGLRLQSLQAMRHANRTAVTVDAHRVKQILRLSDRLQKQCRHLPPSDQELSAASLLSLAFPERIAQRRTAAVGHYLMVSGRGAVLPADDGLVTADYLAIAHMDAGSREGRIWLAMQLHEAELRSLHKAHILEQEQLRWDEQRERISGRQITRFGALLLSSREMQVAPGPQLLNELLGVIRGRDLDCLPWSAGALQLQARILLARELDNDAGWPELTDSWLLENLETWLAPWIEGKRSLKDIRQLDMQTILQSQLEWEEMRQLDRLLPRRWRLADGSSAAIDYTVQPPVLAVPLQTMYGVVQTPVLFRGKQPLLIHLLSPAGRPLQVTADLVNFWANAWHDVKKEMRGRYPKHYWPDDPCHARPVLLKKHLS